MPSADRNHAAGARDDLTRIGFALFDPAILIAVVGVVLTIREWLRNAPLWLDESMLALNVRDRSIAELRGTLWLGQAAPYGWLVGQRGVLWSLGSSERALRLIPVLFGIATLALAVCIARRWLSRTAGVLFVTLCAWGQWLMHARTEAKHYSSDAFWAMLLPALAAWAVEGEESCRRTRWMTWWVVAAVAQWFANGAVFVTPGCAVALLIIVGARYGRREMRAFAAGSLVWLAAFGLHYEIALSYAHHNAYLRSYWASELPPASLGLAGAIAWVARRVGPLAHNPAGVSLALPFWICVVAGVTLHPKRHLALVVATVLPSAFLLAAFGIVPLHERLSLWIVPALYVAVALAVDWGIGSVARDRRHAWRVATGAVIVAIGLLVAADAVKRGWRRLDLAPTSTSNQGTDDRSAARWIAERRRPGDAIITTRAGWPGLWWYGRVPLSTIRPDGQLPDGSVMYRASYESQADCGAALRQAVERHRRVLVYVGFLDLPRDFYGSLIHELSRLGRVVETRQLQELSRVALVEADAPASVGARAGSLPPGGPLLPGCVSVVPATPW